jgi:hypothetical protein
MSAYVQCNGGPKNSVGTSVQVSAAQGVNLTRIFLFINGKDQLQASVQPQIGVFNETGLQRFDLIFAMCAKYGMRGIMALANFEPWLGGYPWCSRCGLGMQRGQPGCVASKKPSSTSSDR